MKTIDDLEAEVRARGIELAANENADDSKPRRYGIDAAEFLAVEDSDEDPWIVKGLVPEGMPTMLAGPPKSRKSWVMLYMAVMIAAGRRVFDLPTVQTRVLVIALEDTARETRRRIRLIMAGLKIAPEELRGWLRVDAGNTLLLDDAEDGAALTDTLAEYRPGVVFVDSLSRIHAADENSRSEMSPIMRAWAEACARFSCSIVILHHVSKESWSGDTKRSLLQRIRGTGDIAAVLRVAIDVTKVNEVSSKIEVDGNLADMHSGLQIDFVDRFDGEKRVATAIAARPALVDRSDTAPTDPLRDHLVGEIVDRLLTVRDLTKTKLRKGLGSKDLVDKAINTCRDRGLIKEQFVGNKHCGYALTPSGRTFAETGRPRAAG